MCLRFFLKKKESYIIDIMPNWIKVEESVIYWYFVAISFKIMYLQYLSHITLEDIFS